MSKIAYRHHRTGRTVYIDHDDPRVAKLDRPENKRWERVEPAKAAPAPRRQAGESA